MSDYPFGETVVVLDGTSTEEDADGNEAKTWAEKATYTNVPLAPADGNGTGGNEDTDQKDLVVIGLTAYFPAGADVTAVDRVRARGEVWDVVGLPQLWQNPYSGWTPGMPVSLRRETG